MNGRWRIAVGLGLTLYATATWAQPAASPDLSYERSGSAGLVASSEGDELDLGYRTHFLGATNTIGVVYGRGNADAPLRGEARTGNSLSASNTVEWGPVSFFAGFTTTRVDAGASVPPLDAFGDYGPEGEAIAHRIDDDDRERVNMLRTGLRFDSGRWFVTADWARLDTRSFLPDSRGLYFSGGYRFRSFTPYASYSRLGAASDTSSQRLTIEGLPAGEKRRVPDFHSALNALLAETAQQTRIAAGVRWDLARRFALQAQYDRLGLHAGAPTLPVNRYSGFQPGDHGNVFSVTLDYAF